MRLFLQLYLAYLVADFIFHPSWMTRRRWSTSVLSGHLAIHIGSGCVAVNLGLTRFVMISIVALSLAHVGLDYAQTRWVRNGWLTFAIFQMAHALVVAVASAGLTLAPPEILAAIERGARNTHLYLYLSAYLAVIFGGGYFVQAVTQPFLEVVRSDLKPGLPSAGRYIGWIERFLILTFVLSGYDAAIGFLLAVKALARYPEIKEDSRGHFAEYFLIGTLTSVGLALAAGIVVRELIGLLNDNVLRL